MSTTTTIPSSISTADAERIRQRAEREADRRLRGRFSRFVDGPEAHAVPSALLPEGTSHFDYLSLAPAARAEAVRPALIEQAVRRKLAEIAAERVPASAPVATPVPASPTPAPGVLVAPRWFVSCRNGCGAMVPVAAPRPTLRSCGCTPAKKSKARRGTRAAA
jgi:hypothetical protein